MIFNKSGRMLEDDFFHKSRRLEIVEEYLYLGITCIFKPSGFFSAAVSRLTEQARMAIFKLNPVCFGAPISVCLKLFDQAVVPILSYCGEIGTLVPFHFRSLKVGNFGLTCDRFCGEAVALKFYRALLGVNKQSCNAAVRGELARYPMIIKILKQAFDYGHRLANETNTSALLSELHKQLVDLGIYGWAGYLKLILDHAGMWTSWQSPNKSQLFEHFS